MSAKVPLVRTTPPSLAWKVCVGFPGLTTISCWSGCIPFCEWMHAPNPYGANAHHGAGVSRLSFVESVNVLRSAREPSGSPAVCE
jgi:hypothetical protein